MSARPGELRLHRGLFISGQVVGLEREPIDGSSISGYCRELDVRFSAYTDEGVFRVGPLLPGAYRLTAEGGAEGTAASPPRTAMAGEAGVVLQLTPGGSMQGRFVDASTGEPLHGRIQVVREQDRAWWFSSRTQADGSFSRPGLATGSYTIHGSTDTLAGRLEGVVIAPGSPADDLEVLLRPGAMLLARYTGERTDLSCNVVSSTGNSSGGWLQPGKSFRTTWCST